jgi:hypothetical protein
MEFFNLDVIHDYGFALLHGLVLTIMLTLIVITLSLGLCPCGVVSDVDECSHKCSGVSLREVIRGAAAPPARLYIYYVLPTMGINLSGLSPQ